MVSAGFELGAQKGDALKEPTDGAASSNASGRDRKPLTVRVPRFVADSEIGLGEAIRRVTATAGVKACGGCIRRARALDRRFTLAPRKNS